MRTHKRLLALCLISVSCVIAAGAQAPNRNSSGAASTDQNGSGSQERKTVISAYEKLGTYKRAGSLKQAEERQNVPDDKQEISFEFRDFRTGPIEEILEKRYTDLVSLPAGEIIQLVHGTHRENGEEQAYYQAQWIAGQYASGNDRQWTIGDLIRFEAAKYYDVGKYVSYGVTVSFQGKSRPYRALALFHDRYKTQKTLKLEFWDSVIGMGGTLTQAWEEEKPPYKPRPKGQSLPPQGALDRAPLRVSDPNSTHLATLPLTPTRYFIH